MIGCFPLSLDTQVNVWLNIVVLDLEVALVASTNKIHISADTANETGEMSAN